MNERDAIRTELLNRNEVVYHETVFLRFLAMLLIVNSHVKFIHPVGAIATGGMVGNSIFFLLSTYGLFLSAQRDKVNLITWYARRLLRLYPSIWIILTFVVVPYSLHNQAYALALYHNSFGELLQLYFLPRDPFWFLEALIIFYIPTYFVIKSFTKKLLLSLLAISAVLYFGFYFTMLDLSSFSIEEYPFKLIFYWSVMLFGVYMGSNSDNITYDGLKDVLCLALFAAGIYIHKYFMQQSYYSSYQYVEHLLAFPMLYCLMKISKSPFIRKTLFSWPLANKGITFVGNSTLELYVAHVSLIPLFVECRIDYPLNIVLFIAVSLLLTYVVKNVSKRLHSFICRA